MGIVTLSLIVLNVLISYKGFTDPSFFERNLFEVGKVLKGREYGRIFMSGFLHVNWTHLFFNMFSLYSFSDSLERYMGPIPVLGIYFASLVGGDLLALFIHRNHPFYRAVGASGAVSGIIFAAIALFPGIHVSLFLIPIGIPGWLFGACYVIYSIYGIRSNGGNIGHEAHLGGALIGLLTTIALVPSVVQENMLPIVLIAIPCLIFIILIVVRPQVLMLDRDGGSSGGNRRTNYTIDDRYNAKKQEEQREIDLILDKLRKHGINSLTQEEKEKLEAYSDRG
jgi:membrane associated rhomboid family serine protease